jgi:hypothetical protein
MRPGQRAEGGGQMRPRGGWAMAMGTTLALALLGCSSLAAQSDEPPESPVVIGKADRDGVKIVRLTRQASDRLGIETIQVRNAPASTPSGGKRPVAGSTGAAGQPTIVPYSAVLYDPEGVTWVYTVPRPLTYVREKVVVVTVGGAGGTETFLSAGPPAGTTVVTTGVVELYGAELGVGG